MTQKNKITPKSSLIIFLNQLFVSELEKNTGKKAREKDSYYTLSFYTYTCASAVP